MELKDFIKQTITSISKAISESQEELKDDGVILNPEKLGVGGKGDRYLKSDGWRYVQDVDFEISVAVENRDKDGLNGKLTVANLFSIGGAAESEKQNSNRNIIRFKIPVAFPSMNTPEEYKSRSGARRVN